MERYQVYVNSVRMWFKTQKEAVEYANKCLSLNIGADLKKEVTED